MGKSIVHCAECGKALREEDFVGGRAATVDDRTYCRDCAPVGLEPEQPSLPRRGSTARIPKASSSSRLAAAPGRRRSVAPIALAIGAAVVVIAAVCVVVLRGGEKPLPEKTALQLAAASGSSASAPPAAPRKEEAAPTLPNVSPELKPEPGPAVPKPGKEELPATAEKSKSPTPCITFPTEGSTFDAPAVITILVEVPGDVAKVEFFEGASKIGEAERRPLLFVWNDVPAGNYTLTAKATTRAGETQTSGAVSIRVTAVVAAVPEDRKPPPPPVPVDLGVDPRRVDAAIAKGVVFLKAAGVKDSMDSSGGMGLGECPELILWTLVHARVPENDPDFVKLFNYIVGKKLERTYAVALQAMILEEVNRVKYQVRIAQCAQFLMDAQCVNGQWSYTGPAQLGTPTTALKLDVATAPGSGPRVKPKVVRKITSIRKMQEGPPTGDNSNAQYAALGLRACHEAGIVIPKAVINRAQTWWRISQHEEEGEKRPGVATGDGAAAAPAGWCYGSRDHGHAAYSSMTAGAVGSVAIWNFLQDEKNWKKDPTLQKGIAWISQHFSVSGNEGPSEHVKDTKWMVYYYLYALERAGILAGTETFGPRQWYREGAQAILAAQKADGSWLAPLPHPDRSETTNQVWDTCFAILFLKRATAPLVASTDVRKEK